jgi:hypothetical protein
VNRWTRKEDNATRLRFGPFVRAQPGRTDKDDRRVRTSSAWGIIFHRGELVSTGSPTRVSTPSLSSPPVAVSPWLAPVGASGRFILLAFYLPSNSSGRADAAHVGAHVALPDG